MKYSRKMIYIYIPLVFTLMVLLFSCSTAFAYSVYTDSTVEPVLETIDSYEYSVSPSVLADADGGETVNETNTYVVRSVYGVYDSGVPSDTYIAWARGLIKEVPFTDDYVFFRSGQYSYTFAYGDFDDGFAGSAHVYQIILPSNYNDGYEFVDFIDSSFSLSVGNGLVYSSLDGYPSLFVDYSYYIFFLLVLFLATVFGCFIARLAFEPLFGRINL